MELAHEKNKSANLFEKEHIGKSEKHKRFGKEEMVPETFPMLGDKTLELPESKEEALRR